MSGSWRKPLFGPDSSPIQIWALEDTTAQITWGQLPPGPVEARAGDSATAIDHRGGPGGLVLTGLPADQQLTIDVLWDGGSTSLRATTLPAPPGQELARFATISDLHLGARRWGASKRMLDTSNHPVPHPYRCARAAIAEAIAWGAQLLVIKGDAVQHESARDFAELGRLVDEFPELPMLLIPGNHDVDNRPGTIPLTVGERELAYTRLIDRYDLPGVRVLVGDTSVPGMGSGSLLRIADPLLDQVDSSDRPVFIGLHHQLQPHRIPRHWPAGIGAPESIRFLDGLDRMVQPATVSSGHTHRNRSRTHGGVLVTEVASTKDWPGVWAGYAVHEGGIRQMVRRIMAPEAISWTEYSRRAVGGLWGKWSPGPIDERCLSRPWARNTSLVR